MVGCCLIQIWMGLQPGDVVLLFLAGLTAMVLAGVAWLWVMQYRKADHQDAVLTPEERRRLVNTGRVFPATGEEGSAFGVVRWQDAGGLQRSKAVRVKWLENRVLIPLTNDLYPDWFEELLLQKKVILTWQSDEYQLVSFQQMGMNQVERYYSGIQLSILRMEGLVGLLASDVQRRES